MSNLFFCSDHHFDHSATIGYDQRIDPRTGELFTDVDTMNEYLVEAWNETVGPRDQVWHLGDFAFNRTGHWMDRLNGHIHIVWGNHDKDAQRYHKQALKLGLKTFASTQDYKRLRYAGKRFILSHYAFRTWHGVRKGAIQLYGHSHGSMDSPIAWSTNERHTNGFPNLSMDVGIMTRPSFKPYHFDKIVEVMQDREIFYDAMYRPRSVKFSEEDLETLSKLPQAPDDIYKGKIPCPD